MWNSWPVGIKGSRGPCLAATTVVSRAVCLLSVPAILLASSFSSAQAVAGEPLAPCPPVTVEAAPSPGVTWGILELIAPLTASKEPLMDAPGAPAAYGSGISSYTEDAESGLGNVIDGSDTSYPLIQSDRVAEGSYAFHLANPGAQDNWFELDVDVDVQAETKLFFQSRLQYATTTQVAKVHVSLDGGSTWPDTVYSQAGTTSSGEGAFSLRQVDLGASYGGLQIRIRFYYDYTGGSHYPQVDTYVGWLVDDIQIGASLEKSEWSIGNPTPYEVLYLEVINRAREDALVEAARLANHADPDITSTYAFYNILPINILNGTGNIQGLLEIPSLSQ